MSIQNLQEVLDRRLRRDLLHTINVAKTATADGRISGTALHDLHGPGSPPVRQTDDEAHTLRLLTELGDLGLVEVVDRRVYREEAYGLGVTLWRVTAAGADLLAERTPPLPAVFDKRRPGP